MNSRSLRENWTSERVERIIVRTVLVLAVVSIIPAAFFGGESFLGELSKVGVPTITIMLGLSLVNYLVRGLRWHLFTVRLGLTLPFTLNLKYYVAGMAMVITPGKLGEAVRLWLLKKNHNVRYDKSVGVLLADRAFDVFAVVLVALASLQSQLGGQGVALMLLAGFCGLGILLLRLRIIETLVSLAFGQLRRVPRLFARARATVRRLNDITSGKTFAIALAASLIGWAAEGVALYLCLSALETEVSVQTSVFVFCVASLIGALTMLPGGLGGAEISMATLLIGYGVEPVTAAAATAVTRATTLWFGVILGAAVALGVLSNDPKTS